MKRLVVIVLAVVLSLCILSVVAVSASPPTTEVEGNFTLTSLVATRPPITANGNTIYIVSLTTEWIGDFVGTDQGVGVFVVRPNGDYALNTRSTLTGSYLDGPIGTMDLHTSSKGNDFTGVFKGRITVISSIDGLAGLHGVLTITNDPLGGDNIYSGKIHFDP